MQTISVLTRLEHHRAKRASRSCGLTYVTRMVASEPPSLIRAGRLEARVLRLYDEGYSTRTIEAMTGIGRMTVVSIARRFGRPGRMRTILVQRIQFKEAIINGIVSGMTGAAIAKMVGISTSAVTSQLRSMNDHRVGKCLKCRHWIAAEASDCPFCDDRRIPLSKAPRNGKPRGGSLVVRPA